MFNRSRSRFRSTAARTHRAPHFMDALESRQLLAADLGVAFDSFGNVPMTLVPGDQLSLPFTIRNVGNTAATGNVTIDFFLSSNATFDTGDTLVESFANQAISLSADGLPNSEDSLTADVTVPNVVPGSYFLLIRLRPASNIGDVNQSNNVSASEDPINYAWKFGNFDGRTNVTLALTDPSGTTVRFGMTGGGVGTVTADAMNTERFNIALSGTGGASQVTIQATGGSGATAGIALINDITGGTVQSITAPTARLHGDITLTGTAGSIRFGDVVGPSLITVQGTTVNTTYTFNNVTNLSIVSASPIQSLTVNSWTDTATDNTVDLVSAPWIGTLRSTGNFQASLNLSGRSGSGRTLGSATIDGQISKGAWRVNGTSGAISAQSTAATWSASIVKALSSFTTTLDFRGTLAAKAITTLTVGRDFRQATVLAGANLGADARLGGTDANADTVSNGNITTINVTGRAINALVGAGLDPVDGAFKNGNDRYVGGKIGTITFGGTVGTGNRFLAPRYTGTMRFHGVMVNPATDVRFRLS